MGFDINKAAAAAKRAADTAKAKAAELAHDNQDKIDKTIGKVSHTIDSKTGGKHSDKITKVAETARKGAAKVAEQRSTDSRLHDQDHDPSDPVTPDHPVRD